MWNKNLTNRYLIGYEYTKILVTLLTGRPLTSTEIKNRLRTSTDIYRKIAELYQPRTKYLKLFTWGDVPNEDKSKDYKLMKYLNELFKLKIQLPNVNYDDSNQTYDGFGIEDNKKDNEIIIKYNDKNKISIKLDQNNQSAKLEVTKDKDKSLNFERNLVVKKIKGKSVVYSEIVYNQEIARYIEKINENYKEKYHLTLRGFMLCILGLHHQIIKIEKRQNDRSKLNSFINNNFYSLLMQNENNGFSLYETIPFLKYWKEFHASGFEVFDVLRKFASEFEGLILDPHFIEDDLKLFVVERYQVELTRHFMSFTNPFFLPLNNKQQLKKYFEENVDLKINYFHKAMLDLRRQWAQKYLDLIDHELGFVVKSVYDSEFARKMGRTSSTIINEINFISNKQNTYKVIPVHEMFLKNPVEDGNYAYKYSDTIIYTDTEIIQSIKTEYKNRYCFLNFHLIPNSMIGELICIISECGSKTKEIFLSFCEKHNIPAECQLNIIAKIRDRLETEFKDNAEPLSKLHELRIELSQIDTYLSSVIVSYVQTRRRIFNHQNNKFC